MLDLFKHLTPSLPVSNSDLLLSWRTSSRRLFHRQSGARGTSRPQSASAQGQDVFESRLRTHHVGLSAVHARRGGERLDKLRTEWRDQGGARRNLPPPTTPVCHPSVKIRPRQADCYVFTPSVRPPTRPSDERVRESLRRMGGENRVLSERNG